MKNLKVAILYQTIVPPAVDGILKPMKKGGYSDSGADIAMALVQNGIEVMTPVSLPKEETDLDWVFPDTAEGIETAISKGANLFWLNTVLYEKHPILNFSKEKILIVGQHPEIVERFDDKFFTNNFLKQKLLPIPKSVLLQEGDQLPKEFDFPLVIKPVRGRGSQGVAVVYTKEELHKRINEIIFAEIYGNKVMAEEFLPGKEITLSIMPPGKYEINNEILQKPNHWSLPAVERFNHINDIAPYNGIVAVVNNSRVLSQDELLSTEIKKISKKCEMAASFIGARAPVRIDCRKNRNGIYNIFDLNLKPNMTGTSRSHRSDQASLTTIAAKEIGWTYNDLIKNMLFQNWTV